MASPSDGAPAAPRLIVFARAPVPGRCKTRLIPAQGARGAARVHRLLTERTLAIAAASGVATELWCEPDTRHPFFRHCRLRHGVPLRRQPAGDLGRKMACALRGAGPTVVVGTDCAALQSTDIVAAFGALRDGAQAVLQPAQDGGYVLIGAGRGGLGELAGIAWSSGRELAQTLARLRRRGLAVHLLPPSWDVDHPRDLRRARRAGLL